MSDYLNKAKATAASALDTAAGLASQAATTAVDYANQAANSQTAANVTSQAKTLGSQAGTLAGQAAEQAKTLAGHAQAQAHAYAPGIIPAPIDTSTSAAVDTSADLSPTNEKDREKVEKLFASRASAHELQDKGILKGQPNDSLAGKKAELQKSMLEDRLDTELSHRPTADELVKKGILNPDEAPPV